MTELKTIIEQLEDSTYKIIEKDLVKNKSENFLFLLRSYKKEKYSDEEIIKKLSVNKNSFYVLKSRLHNKIQNYLTTHIKVSKEDVLLQLQNLTELCYNTPRELANSVLEKLEKDLIHYDMHSELQLVYSTLKKNHLYSENYFHYSQLYNKQVALGYSKEKVEELLGEFCVILSQYNFSKTQLLLDKLLFLRNEVINHSKLNPSRQITIIKNIIDLQLGIFCKPNINHGISPFELLQETASIINELPETSQYQKWNTIIDYLYFEHYYSTDQIKLATIYYIKTSQNFFNLLLYTGLCVCSQFLISKICFLQETGKISSDEFADYFNGLYDQEDEFSKVNISFYNAMVAFYDKKINKAILLLNDLYEQHSFKDYLHVQIELKLLTAFMLIETRKNYDASKILSNLKRKIKIYSLENQYNHAYQLINLLLLEANDKSSQSKKRNIASLYLFQNTGQYKIIPYLNTIIKDKYNIQ